jgi:hypothetical protein
LPYATVEAGQEQLTLRQAVKKLCKCRGKLEPSFIVQTAGISAAGHLNWRLRDWYDLIAHFLSTFGHLPDTTDCGTTQFALQVRF